MINAGRLNNSNSVFNNETEANILTEATPGHSRTLFSQVIACLEDAESCLLAFIHSISNNRRTKSY